MSPSFSVFARIWVAPTLVFSRFSSIADVATICGLVPPVFPSRVLVLHLYK